MNFWYGDICRYMTVFSIGSFQATTVTRIRVELEIDRRMVRLLLVAFC